eukprot:CAMPEP_0176325806 /NCGR_PEP_ID=MMETSP0121_2-20121125/73601_1 /TAXON_ID=160619 /ORGANISM="Kryptoperidinium foliaceum, Strain CCMP 1326" /LENGTH=52 /DNA_ID=CAMNT_0017668385 /DNA_START=108 /DNA_END=262 /DNA_ORIENTATION=-
MFDIGARVWGWLVAKEKDTRSTNACSDVAVTTRSSKESEPGASAAGAKNAAP